MQEDRLLTQLGSAVTQPRKDQMRLLAMKSAPPKRSPRLDEQHRLISAVEEVRTQLVGKAPPPRDVEMVASPTPSFSTSKLTPSKSKRREMTKFNNRAHHAPARWRTSATVKTWMDGLSMAACSPPAMSR